jgi:hypothetical protein
MVSQVFSVKSSKAVASGTFRDYMIALPQLPNVSAESTARFNYSMTQFLNYTMLTVR